MLTALHCHSWNLGHFSQPCTSQLGEDPGEHLDLLKLLADFAVVVKVSGLTGFWA